MPAIPEGMAAFQAAVTRHDFAAASAYLEALAAEARTGAPKQVLADWLDTLQWALAVTRATRAQLAQRLTQTTTAASYSESPAPSKWQVEG